MGKLLFIINPVAGKGKGNEVIPKITQYFSKSEYDILISPQKGSITSLVKDQLNTEDYKSVIAVGGDGTLMETINGLEHYSGSIGVIPIGSGNDFAKTLGISEDVEASLEIISQGNTREIYSACVNNQRFLNVIGIGIDAMIIDYKDKSKYLKGKLNYLLATIKAILSYDATELEIIVDGEVFKYKPLFVAIGNGKYIGNGMKITPNADLTSENFEICIVGNLKKTTLLKNITNLYKGLHGVVKGVEFLKGKEVKIVFNRTRRVDVDGNLIRCEAVSIKKSERKIKFLVKE